MDASSVDTKSVGVETVDGDENRDNTIAENSENTENKEISTDNESEISGVNDRRPPKEGVSATDRRENED